MKGIINNARISIFSSRITRIASERLGPVTIHKCIRPLVVAVAVSLK